MERLLEKKIEIDRSSITKTEAKTFGYYTLIALFGILIVGYAIDLAKINNLFPTFATVWDSAMYSFFIAVAEEVWFRGVIADFLLTSKIIKNSSLGKLGYPFNTLIISALIFTGYHWARYGTYFDALVYVFAGGLILGWVAYKTKRLSSVMAGHGLNNIITIIMNGGLKVI